MTPELRIVGELGSEAAFHTIDGMGRHWPDGRILLPERVVGKTTHKIKVTDVIQEFS